MFGYIAVHTWSNYNSTSALGGLPPALEQASPYSSVNNCSRPIGSSGYRLTNHVATIGFSGVSSVSRFRVRIRVSVTLVWFHWREFVADPGRLETEMVSGSCSCNAIGREQLLTEH